MKQMSKKKSTNLWEANDAIAGIVIAVLLAGLIFAIISTIQLSYVPQWMEQQEAKHMDEVADQFALLKLTIDMQALTEKNNYFISTPITLGNKELPIFMSERAFGFLDISDGTAVLSINDGSTIVSRDLGTIRYSSSNSYYLDQSYIYEAGAVILSQDQKNIMCMLPSFSVRTTPTIEISCNLIDIVGVGEKTSAGGYGTYPIQTEFSASNHDLITGVRNITMTTTYLNSWHLYFNSTLQAADLTYGMSGDFWIHDTESSVIVEFNTALNVNIDVNTVDIEAQIAPGWVE